MATALDPRRFRATLRRATLALLAFAGASVLAAADYEIGMRRRPHVIVLDQPGLTGEFPVDAEGMITFPFLGRLKAVVALGGRGRAKADDAAGRRLPEAAAGGWSRSRSSAASGSS